MLMNRGLLKFGIYTWVVWVVKSISAVDDLAWGKSQGIKIPTLAMKPRIVSEIHAPHGAFVWACI